MLRHASLAGRVSSGKTGVVAHTCFRWTTAFVRLDLFQQLTSPPNSVPLKNIAKRKNICVYFLCLRLWKARYVDAEA